MFVGITFSISLVCLFLCLGLAARIETQQKQIQELQSLKGEIVAAVAIDMSKEIHAIRNEIREKFAH